MIHTASKINLLSTVFTLDLRLHYTSNNQKDLSEESKLESVNKPDGLAGIIYQGRPDLPAILQGVINQSPDGPAGVGVGVCGPAALGDSVERIVKGVKAEDKGRVGGVECHAERFSL